MATSYETIFNRFYKQLVKDNKFFKYSDTLTEAEKQELIKDRTIDLLNQAIDMLYEYDVPQVDFYDKDDTLQVFNFDLINQEIPLLVKLMRYKYFEEDKNLLHAVQVNFKSSELNILSPANERSTTVKMIDDIKTDCENAINHYFSMNRSTWTPKSIYGGE